ncbi:hypothetical protein F5Y06DRAFT_305367 [Hypoxylon sp. FL0890]|nr:hypothetical protein F5Y06DRAFT_305367 [Hypoxylon sp. FL0890]
MASSTHPEPDIDRGTTLIALFSAECGVSLLFLALRLWARSSIGARGWDDIFMAITWVLFAVSTVFIGLIGANGGARHIYYLDESQAIYMTELNWVIQPFVIMALGTGKIAVCILILRLFGSTSKWRTRGIWFLMILTSILTILTVIFTFAQCKVATALWDPAIRAKTYCWDPVIQSNFSISTQSINCAVDFILAFLPVTFIWKLRLSLRKKIALVVLLSGALFSGICAAIKTSQLVHLAARSDFTWGMFGIHVWTGTEIFVIILCGSIPTLSPLWDRFSRDKVQTSTVRSTWPGTNSSRDKYWKSSFGRRDYDFELSSINGPSDTGVRVMGVADFRDNDSRSRLPMSQKNMPMKVGQSEGASIQITRSFHVDYAELHGI